jgi:hypothetical protein
MGKLVERSPSLVMAVEYSPHHFAGFGSTGAEVLDVIAGFDVAMFDLGMGGPDPYHVKPIAAELLLRRYVPTRKFFTNLLLVKGRPDVRERLDAALEQVSP